LDNAANNQTCMKELSNLLEECQIEYDPIENRIPCFPHVINICVKHILDDYATADFSDVENTWTVCGQDITKIDYISAVTGKTLERTRNLVRSVRASNQQCANFRDTTTIGNEKVKSFGLILPTCFLCCPFPLGAVCCSTPRRRRRAYKAPRSRTPARRANPLGLNICYS
jgi:hypothetical protein